MKQINLNLIRTDGGTQARLRLNQEVVNEYAEHMKDGDQFPPMTVFHDGSDFWLADGYHRLFAHKANGSSLVEVEVITGTLEDAKLYAYEANGKRGLSMTAEDNRNVIILMLKHPKWSQWSNAEIARHVGVSKMTVGRVKHSLEEVEEPATKKYINKHGQEAEMKMDNIANKPAQRPVGTKPDSSTINEDKLMIAQLNDQISELSDTITALSEENALLRDKIAIGQWNASEIEKIDIQDTVTELREQIRVLEIENKSMRDGRDMYQNRNAELMRTVKSQQAKLKKLEA